MSEPPRYPHQPDDPTPGPPLSGGYGQQGPPPGYGYPQYGQPDHPAQDGSGYGPPPTVPPTGYGQQGPTPAPYGYGPEGQSGQPGRHGQPAAPVGLQIDLGVRARRRPDPRAGVSIAGIGAVLALAGALIWGGGYVIEGFALAFSSDDGPSSAGDSRRFLGAGLFLVLAVAGYAAVIIRRRGPVATAGTVLAAFGVPLAILFVSLSLTGGYPFNLDAFYLGSIVIWVATYAFVPGAKGRALFLTAALIALPSYIGLKIVGDQLVQTASGLFGGGSGDSGFGSDSGGTGGAAIVGIVFGLAYYAAAYLLDRRGRPGVSVAFVVAGFSTTASGIASAVGDLDQIGTGIVLVLLGAALTVYGGWAGRRATTWLWAAGFGLGVLLIIAKVISDGSYVVAGIVLIVVGLVTVVAAQVVSGVRNERPDLDESEPAPAPS